MRCNSRRPPFRVFARNLVLAVLFSLGWLVAAPAWAQVRQAPSGNEHPDARGVAPPRAPDAGPGPAHNADGGGAPLDLVPADPNERLGRADAAAKSRGLDRAAHRRFADRVNLDPLQTVAVFHNGRATILETLARETLSLIYGKPAWKDLTAPEDQQQRYAPVFTFLDLVFNKPYYFDKPMIYVEVLPFRREVVSALPAEDREKWLKRGRVTPLLLTHPQVRRTLSGAGGDLRLMNGRDQVLTSAQTFDHVSELLRVVSPSPGGERWAHILELGDTRVAAADGGLAGTGVTEWAGVSDPQAARAARRAWDQLAEAWRSLDAEAVNRAAERLAERLAQINPGSYPESWRREAERIYNRTNRLTIGYVAYFGALVLLLIAAGAPGRRRLLTAGLVMLGAGFVLHTASMAVRWSLADRNWIPLHNQYESFIAISWFTVVVGVALMMFLKRPMFGAAAAAVGAVTQLVAHSAPIPSAEITQVAGILATSNILKVHVTMVLTSYGLIALAFCVSVAYLAVHYWRKLRLAHAPATAGTTAATTTAAGTTAAADRSSRDAHTDPDPDAHASATASHGPPTPSAKRLAELDRAQMTVMQLAFWILGVGVLLGAYWADHAWGRWWAWDPKETWALITWIIYLIVIHVRLGVNNRGLVTAWLGVLGFFVMLWTYWGVNLLLAGLHSYA